jgi:hypothetical protein
LDLEKSEHQVPGFTSSPGLENQTVRVQAFIIGKVPIILMITELNESWVSFVHADTDVENQRSGGGSGGHHVACRSESNDNSFGRPAGSQKSA